MTAPSSEPTSETAWAGAKRVGLALVALLLSFAPEVTAFVVLGVAGGIIGAVYGISATAEALEHLGGGGIGGHAGLLVLLVPLLAVGGPAVEGLLIGAFGPLPLVLLVHATVLALFPRRDRHFVVWATTAAYWLPFPVGLLGGAATGIEALVIVGPFLGALALFGSLLWFGARLILNGRSVRAWWREGDRSMLAAALLSTLLGGTILWGACLLFPLVPLSPVALVLAVVLTARLIVLGRRTTMAMVVLGVALLHLVLEGIMVWMIVRELSGGTT